MGLHLAVHLMDVSTTAGGNPMASQTLLNPARPHAPIPHVLIVGGGLAGTAVALHLLRDSPDPLHISIVEPRAQVGPGVAYSTESAAHLVNGLAPFFSLYEDDPSHFSRWLAERAEALGWVVPAGSNTDSSMPPRPLYGRYIVATLQEARQQARPGVTLTHVRGRVTDLVPQGGHFLLELEDQRTLRADQVVLATGVFGRRADRLPFKVDPQVLASPRYVSDLYSSAAWRGVPHDETVVLLGSGLSALDSLISAEQAGFTGRYLALSRRGQRLQPRRALPPWPDFLQWQPNTLSLRDVLRQVRLQRRLIAQQGEDWQRLVPTLRQSVAPLWAAASPRDRRRFVNRVRVYWDVALHRTAPEALAWQERVQQQGRYQHLSASVEAVHLGGDGRLRVSWRDRASGEHHTLLADRVVNCLGFEYDWTQIEDPLVQNLLRKRLVLLDPLGFGIQAQRSDCRVLGADARAQPGLYAIGHPLRGLFWESNSIPEQVPQAGLVARGILQGVAARDTRGAASAAAEPVELLGA